MIASEANGFIIEQDFCDPTENELILTHTEDLGQAIKGFITLVKGFIDLTPTFSVRLYAVQFEAEDKEGRDAEALRIAGKNFQHCKSVQVGAFYQIENTVLVDLNAFVGPVIVYGHDGDDVPHTHGTPE